jgi:hypothetical protein
MADDHEKVTEQLAALAHIHELFDRGGIDCWLFGGWAVDFHAGVVTWSHDDIDIAVWKRDLDRISTLLEGEGWVHAPQESEDGYTGYERANVRLELAFLARTDDGRVFTPLRDGQAPWPDGAFDHDVEELRGVKARVITRRALVADKSELRDDPRVAAKDRADLLELLRER